MCSIVERQMTASNVPFSCHSSIRAVTLTEEYFGPAIAIEHDQGTSQLPMTVHGSKRATEAMARSIADWVEPERIDTGA